jgi:hypothetical protein
MPPPIDPLPLAPVLLEAPEPPWRWPLPFEEDDVPDVEPEPMLPELAPLLISPDPDPLPEGVIVVEPLDCDGMVDCMPPVEPVPIVAPPLPAEPAVPEPPVPAEPA